jgi:aspartate-semialdehyde dehydrogenase
LRQQELRLSIIHRLGEWIQLKLIVPEINASELTAADKIIANQTALPFKWSWFLLLHRKYNIKRVVSTYQSITGTGVKAVQQLENEYAGVQGRNGL